MIKTAIGIIIIGLVYLCLAILLFAPTIYAVWIYVIGRKVKLRRRNPLNSLLSTVLINLIIVYVIFHFGFGSLAPSILAETDNLALQTMKDAIVCERKHFDKHGRYFSVGPVKGPYDDENGVKVPRDVILMIEPYWNKSHGKEDISAYAMHVWGKNVAHGDALGNLESTSRDSQSVSQVKSKLLNSTR
jgi:hypothetical protein